MHNEQWKVYMVKSVECGRLEDIERRLNVKVKRIEVGRYRRCNVCKVEREKWKL